MAPRSMQGPGREPGVHQALDTKTGLSDPPKPDLADPGSVSWLEKDRVENPARFTSQLKKKKKKRSRGFQVWFI